jgi:hypothetical protein
MKGTAMYYAHTAPRKPDWEPLKEHLLNVAEQARLFASVFGAGEEGFVKPEGAYPETSKENSKR